MPTRNASRAHGVCIPRYGAAANSVASKEGDIYFMGGLINGSEVKGDLWMFEGAGASAVLSAAKGDASVVGIHGLAAMPCYPVTSATEGPGPRVGHRSLLVGNAFIVFGGDTKVEPNDPLDDTLYLLNTSSRQWSRAIPPGPRPKGRYGHTLNIVGSKIYVFGGQSDDGSFFNDLISFDLNALQKASNRWQFLVENTASAANGEIPVDEATGKLKVPPPRTNHTMVTFNDRLWLFGGTDGVHWFNDAWVYDPRTNTWTSIDYVGVTPTPREGHAAAMVGDIMYVFGGRNSALEDLDDLVAFRCTQRRWYTFQKMGPAPSPRSGHAMSVVGRWIVVIGGEPNGEEREDDELSLVYVLDTGKIKYPDSPAAYPGQSPPNHLIHPMNQRTMSPHGREPPPAAAAMQRRVVSPTGAGRAIGPAPQGQGPQGPPHGPPQGPPPATNAPSQDGAHGRPGPSPSAVGPSGVSQAGGGDPRSQQRSPSGGAQPPLRSPQHAPVAANAGPAHSGGNRDANGRPADRQPPPQQAARPRVASPSAGGRPTPQGHEPAAQAQAQNSTGDGRSQTPTNLAAKVAEGAGLELGSQSQQQRQPSQAAAANGSTDARTSAEETRETQPQSEDGGISQQGVGRGSGMPQANKKSTHLSTAPGGPRATSPALPARQQQPGPGPRPRVMSVGPMSVPLSTQEAGVAGSRQSAMPNIDISAASPRLPVEATPQRPLAAPAALPATHAGAEAPRTEHQQSQASRRTPSTATSVSHYTTTSTVSAATIPPPHAAHHPEQGDLQRSTSSSSDPKSAARAMEAGEAAPLLRSPSGHRRRLGSVSSVGSRSRDSMFSVGAPGPATHDGGEVVEDSLLSVAAAPLSTSSSSSAQSAQQQQQQQSTAELKRNSKRVSAIDLDAPKSPRLTPHQEALMRELDAVKRKNAWLAGELALARKAGYVSAAASSPSGGAGPRGASADRFRNASHGSLSSFGSSFGGTPSNADSEGTVGARPMSSALSRHNSLHGLSALEADSSMLKDEDKPMLEALLAMRAELVNMQTTIDQQAAMAARKIAEVEQQREVALREAVYAQAKVAALGGGDASAMDGSRSGTAMSNSSRSATPINAVAAKEKEMSQKDFDTLQAERATDMSRRLALALVGQNEMKQRIEVLTAEIKEEQQARQLADELREATNQRLTELEAKNRNLVELESLRAEATALHDVLAELESSKEHAESQLKIAELDKRDLEARLEEAEMLAAGSADNLAALKDALLASEEKTNLVTKQLSDAEEREGQLTQQLHEARRALDEKSSQCLELERQVAESTDMVNLLQQRSEEDRVVREDLDRHIAELRSGQETAATRLEECQRKLRDANEVAEKHAREAATHRAAFLSGLTRATSRSVSNGTVSTGKGSDQESLADERVTALREQLEKGNERARAQQEAAEAATEKLRRAEERIAGLEAYQEQTAREGLQLRRQLQSVTKGARSLSLEIRDLKAQLETQQRDANALAVQHSALKQLLNDRNLHRSDSARRSPHLDSSSASATPRYGTPDLPRLRELEQQLQASLKAQDEMKSLYERREKDAENMYNEKLEQLGKDYRSAVHYVKGTEKMLRRMKDELEKYKSQNAKFQSELESVGRQSSSSEYSSRAVAEWEVERAHLQSALADAQEKMSSAILELESQVSKLHEDVAAARAERDKARRAEEGLEKELHELSEKGRTEIARMRSENAALESRASDAERRVMMLLESSITAQQAQAGAVRRSQSNASSDTIGRFLSRSRGNSVNTSSREAEPDAENVPLRSSSAAAATTMASGGTLRSSMPGQCSDQPPDQRTSLALDSLTSELDALRWHWEASNRRNHRLSDKTLDPDSEEFARVRHDFETADGQGEASKGDGGEEDEEEEEEEEEEADGKGDPLMLSESLVGWRKKLAEEEQQASMTMDFHDHQSASALPPVSVSGNADLGGVRAGRGSVSPAHAAATAPATPRFDVTATPLPRIEAKAHHAQIIDDDDGDDDDDEGDGRCKTAEFRGKECRTSSGWRSEYRPAFQRTSRYE
ncbi:Negative regulator of mitotic exit [Ascosphaera acerosa]|nr:Negative regulator of mitotic exit [Ascosphaera acerosa]